MSPVAERKLHLVSLRPNDDVPGLLVDGLDLALQPDGFGSTVNIVGEVLPGVKLHASGDVSIAGGIIVETLVRAGGTVMARFVENTQAHAGTNIVIHDTVLQAELYANDQIVVGV